MERLQDQYLNPGRQQTELLICYRKCIQFRKFVVDSHKLGSHAVRLQILLVCHSIQIIQRIRLPAELRTVSG